MEGQVKARLWTGQGWGVEESEIEEATADPFGDAQRGGAGVLVAQAEGGEGLGCRRQRCPSPTHALSPSFLRICRPQSHVFRYLCASSPCRTPTARSLGNPCRPGPAPAPPLQDPAPTCIRVLITSSGVFPKTLAAPAMAPNTPVISGFMGLLGLSPGWG